jgi:hypothetical protein
LRKNIASPKRAGDLHSSAVQPQGATVARYSQPEVLPMMISSRMAAAIGASFLLLATPVFAQSTTPAPAAGSDTAAPAAKSAKPRSAESLECSKQADDKGLKGKERKKFRRDCIKEAKAAAKKQ